MYNVNLNFFFTRTDNPDFNIPHHTHKCYELVYYFSGKGYCYIDGKRFDYGKNDFVLIPPNAGHNDVHTETCRLTCLGFTLLAEDGALLPAVYSDTDKAVSGFLKTVASEFKNKKLDFVSVINSLIGCIVVKIDRQAKKNADKASPHLDVLGQALSYIDEYFLTDISPEQIANLSNYSYHHFRHLFKDAMGVSVKQYVINKRVEHAKHLLATTSLSVTEIGYQCGFSASSLFIKQFKKAVDVTPAKYRTQLHSGVCFSDNQSTYANDSDGE